MLGTAHFIQQHMSNDSPNRRNHVMNAGIVLLSAVVILLGYSFFQRTSSPRPDPTRVFNPDGLLGDVIQVEVLNGCGIAGLASRVTHYLRSYRFDVVQYGNYAAQDVEKTRIIDRIGNLDAARQIAMALGVPASSVEQKVQKDLYLDVSVIIGRDYEHLTLFRSVK